MLAKRLKEISKEYKDKRIRDRELMEQKRKEFCDQNLKKYIEQVNKKAIMNDLLSEAQLGGVEKQFNKDEIAYYSESQSSFDFDEKDLINTFVNILKEIDSELNVRILTIDEGSKYENIVVDVSWGNI